VSGQQPHGLADRTAAESVVGRDLLRAHLVEERRDTGVRAGLLGPRRQVEQRADRVEIPVRRPRRVTAPFGRGTESARPAGALPERPQHLLGRAPRDELLVRATQQLAEPLTDLHGGIGAAGRVDQRPECDGVGECVANQLGGGSGWCRGRGR
jgi:hypothetical protein